MIFREMRVPFHDFLKFFQVGLQISRGSLWTQKVAGSVAWCVNLTSKGLAITQRF